MNARSDLLIKIGATLKPFDDKLNELNRRLKRVSYRAERTGADLTKRVTLPIVAAGVAAVRTFADFDRMEKGLTALNGSAAAGEQQFNRLNNIVLDTRTTLDLRAAALGAQRLRGAGKSAQFAERTIKQLGIAATVSGSNIDDVGGVIRQFTQILGKGKIEQEDLNSILDRMPALGALIKKEFGASTAEQIRATGISMDQFVERLTSAIEKNEDFQNVQGGLAKAFESFSNAVQVGIRPLGKAISQALNLEVNLARLATFIATTAEAFANLDPATQKFIIYTAAAAAAIGPLTFGIGAAARLLPTLTSGFSILSGPILAASKNMLRFGANAKLSLTLFAKRGFWGNAVRYAGSLDSALLGLRAATAALLSPVGLTIAAIGLLVGGFVAAYRNSEFFRRQIYQVGQSINELITGLVNLGKRVFPDLSISFESVGDVFQTVFAVIGGGISATIQVFLSLVDSVKLIVGAVRDVKNLKFGDAAEKLQQTLLNPATIIEKAKEIGSAFVTTFNETVDGKPISVPSFAIDQGGQNNGGDGNTDGQRKVPKAAKIINLEPTQLSDQAREKVGEYFNEFVIGGRNVEFLQRKLDGLTINPPNVGVYRSVVGESAYIFEGLTETFDTINARAEVFGGTFDAVGAKISATKEAINEAIEDGFKPTDDVLVSLKEKLEELQDAQDSVTTKFGEMSSSLTALKGISGTAFDAVAQAMSKGESAVKAFGNAVLAAVRDAIAAEIKLAVASQVASALKTVPFPFNVALAAGAGAAASALFTSALGAVGIPALAEGGLVNRPQLALIGEAGPEVVVPLNRLEQFRNNARNEGGGGGMVEFVIRGTDLVGMLPRAQAQQARA